MFRVKSMIPGILWPAIPNGRASQLLAIQLQLELSQWLPPDQIMRRQFEQLSELLRHASQHIRGYRERLSDLKLYAGDCLEIEEWKRIPLLTREAIQQAGVGLCCADAVKIHGPIASGATSGSSGRPVMTIGTTVTRLFYNALLLRQHLWHSHDLKLKLASIRSRGIRAGEKKEAAFDNWGLGTTDVAETGPAFILDVSSTIEEQADFLLRHDPEYLNTYPSIVQELTNYFSKSSQRLTRLRAVRTFGEVLDPSIRDACRRLWNVKVIDSYSSQELGHIAFQCPDHEHYHVQSESVLVEVLDDQGEWCKPGEIGRLVITSLHNFAMPLIRYDIGDYAEVGDICPCGRGLPVLKRVVGRQRNMFILPDGRRVWPAFELYADEQQALPPIQQFQLIQRTVDSVELLVVCPRMLTDAEHEWLGQLVERAIGFPMQLKVTYVSEIKRGATGKYEDFRCEVQR